MNSKYIDFFNEYKIIKQIPNQIEDYNDLIRKFSSKKKSERIQAEIYIKNKNITIEEMIKANTIDIHATWIKSIIEYCSGRGFTTSEAKLTMNYIVEFYKEMYKDIKPEEKKNEYKWMFFTSIYKTINKDIILLNELVNLIIKVKNLIKDNYDKYQSFKEPIDLETTLLNSLYNDMAWCLITSIRFYRFDDSKYILKQLKEHELTLNYVNKIGLENIFITNVFDNDYEHIQLYNYLNSFEPDKILSEITNANGTKRATLFKLYTVAQNCNNINNDYYNTMEVSILNSLLNEFETKIKCELENNNYEKETEYDFSNFISSLVYYYNPRTMNYNWYRRLFNDYKVTKNYFYLSIIKKALIKLINREKDSFIYYQAINFESDCMGKCFEEYYNNGYFICNDDNSINPKAVKKAIDNEVWSPICKNPLIHSIRTLVNSKVDNKNLDVLLKLIFEYFIKNNLSEKMDKENLKLLLYDVFCKNISKLTPEFVVLEENEFRQREDGILWEKLSGLLIEEIYKESEINYHTYLPNGLVPDYMIKLNGKTIIIETKKSCYFMKNIEDDYDIIKSKEYINYSDYCDELHFWILEKATIKKSIIPANVKIYFPNDLMKNIDQESYISVAIQELLKKSKLKDNEYILLWIEENNIIDKLKRHYKIECPK